MNEFFKPRRRKIGVLTLAMTCVLMAGWVRSFSFCDLWKWQSIGFISANGHLLIPPPQPWEMTLEWPEWSTTEFEESSLNSIRWKWRFMGFECGEFPFIFSSRIPFLLLPFWAIVIPSILLSAWLLLSKPRAKADSVPQIADTPINNA